MTRENLLEGDQWDERHEDIAIRTRRFGRPRASMLGASLHELQPGSPGFRLHAHHGSEEMFFVVSGRPTLRTATGEEQLAPGDVVSCREGRAGLHTSANHGGEPARILAVSAGRYPDVVAYPEVGVGWVATREPEGEPDAGGPGIIARFDLLRDP